jgi:hypothetical protein
MHTVRRTEHCATRNQESRDYPTSLLLSRKQTGKEGFRVNRVFIRIAELYESALDSYHSQEHIALRSDTAESLATTANTWRVASNGWDQVCMKLGQVLEAGKARLDDDRLKSSDPLILATEKELELLAKIDTRIEEFKKRLLKPNLTADERQRNQALLDSTQQQRDVLYLAITKLPREDIALQKLAVDVPVVLLQLSVIERVLQVLNQLATEMYMPKLHFEQALEHARSYISEFKESLEGPPIKKMLGLTIHTLRLFIDEIGVALIVLEGIQKIWSQDFTDPEDIAALVEFAPKAVETSGAIEKLNTFLDALVSSTGTENATQSSTCA